jgi:hypothetical protein
MSLGSGIRDPGSGINLSWIQGPKRHRIPDPDPQHCCRESILWSDPNNLMLESGSRKKLMPDSQQRTCQDKENVSLFPYMREYEYE